jgi:GlcNAc-P-P-Und epimerase
MKSSVIITGGSGFVGGHLIDYLLGKDKTDRILVLDLKEPDRKHPKIDFVLCDIRKSITVSLPKEIKYQTCFHLAALCKEPGYDWDEYFVTNHIGTQNVCAFADSNGINHIVFTSTMMVYRAGEICYDEKSITAPDTAYGISKILAEQALWTWKAQDESRRLWIIRPGVVFGRAENGNYTSLFYALKYNVFAYVGKKSTIKSSIYVKDLARCLDFIRLKRDGIYNAVIPTPLSMEQIVKDFCKVFGWTRIIPTFPYRLTLFASYCFEFFAFLGVHTKVHHRRIQKLYYSTNISAKKLTAVGFQIKFNLRDALEDWKQDCYPKKLY